MRRAFTQAKNGRPGPAPLEIPGDVMREEVEAFDYQPTKTFRTAPDPADVEAAARAILEAERPVLYAGQGVQLRQGLGRAQGAGRVARSAGDDQPRGQERFPGEPPAVAWLRRRREPQHGLRAHPGRRPDLRRRLQLRPHRLRHPVPAASANRKYVHSTNDPSDINKDIAAEYAVVGDAKLTLRAMIDCCQDLLNGWRATAARQSRPRSRASAMTG